MAIFSSDLEALIYLLIIMAGFYLINKLYSLTLGKSKKIPLKQKTILNFVIKIITVITIIFFVIGVVIVTLERLLNLVLLFIKISMIYWHGWESFALIVAEEEDFLQIFIH